MKSPRVTSPVEEKGANMDGVEREGGADDPDCLDLNCALLRLTVAASIAHMKVKWSDAGKGTIKWCMILVIAEGKISLLRDAESL